MPKVRAIKHQAISRYVRGERSRSAFLCIRTDGETIEELNTVAGRVGLNRNWVVNEAIAYYLQNLEQAKTPEAA